MEIRKVDTGYNPRPLQKVLHQTKKRFNLYACHRRFGKTVYAHAEIVDGVFTCPHKNPNFAYVATTFGQAETVVWQYFMDSMQNIPGFKPTQSKLTIQVARPWMGDVATIRLLGSDNPGSKVGTYYDGVVFDEYGEMVDPENLLGRRFLPMLSDRKGWLIVIGTVNGRNAFYRLRNTAIRQPHLWNVREFRASETKIISEEELAIQKANMSAEAYAMEYECDWDAAVQGGFYTKEMAALEKGGRITSVPYDPSLPVRTYWDIGVSDTTTIWYIQSTPNGHRCIDYDEESGWGANKWAKVVMEKPYHYSGHYLPHDAAHREFSNDARSTEDTLRDLGLKGIEIVPRTTNRYVGIDAARVVLPMCWMDAVNCSKGIEALKNYMKKFDSKNQVYSQTPVHNWASHGCDAFRNFAIVSKGIREPFEDGGVPQKVLMEWDEFLY